VVQPLWVSLVSRHPKKFKLEVSDTAKSVKGKGTSDLLASKGLWESPISRQLLNALKDA